MRNPWLLHTRFHATHQRSLIIALMYCGSMGEPKIRELLDNFEVHVSAMVQGRSFAEMRKRTVLAYQNRAIAALEIIEELIKLAKETREATHRGERTWGCTTTRTRNLCRRR